MAGVTQTIPSYSAGMSEQPDNLKFPGQVVEAVNAIPDITKGLFKRPGFKRIDTSAITGDNGGAGGTRQFSTNEGKLINVQSGGSWFHYYRDETEGSYIGQIASDGEVRVWRCSDGRLMTTAYGTGGATALKAYLATNTPENIQTVTINDSTFVSNRDTTKSETVIQTNFTADYARSSNIITVTKIDHGLTVNEHVNLNFTSGGATDGDFIITSKTDDTFTVASTGSNISTQTNGVLVAPLTDKNPDAHFALVELIRAENGRQYGLNITNGTDNASRNVTLKRATRIRIKSQTLNEEVGGAECLGIGTEVFDITNDNSNAVPTSAFDTSAETLSITSHGFETNTILIYHNGDGTSAQVASADIPQFRDLYVTQPTTNTFKLKFHPDGGVLDLTGTGNNNQRFRPAEKGIVINSSGNFQHDGTKKNLVFRISTLGQQGNANNSSTDFVCSYQPEVTLLHGGEGWETGDQITVAMTGQGLGGGGTNAGGDDKRIAIYTIEVTDHEETLVAAK